MGIRQLWRDAPRWASHLLRWRKSCPANVDQGQNGKWGFIADAELNELCNSIVTEMVRLFDITEDEAVLRINRQWKGVQFKGTWDMVYHEDALTWAKNIYYGHENYWWFEGEERERRQLPSLKPKPL